MKKRNQASKLVSKQEKKQRDVLITINLITTFHLVLNEKIVKQIKKDRKWKKCKKIDQMDKERPRDRKKNEFT